LSQSFGFRRTDAGRKVVVLEQQAGKTPAASASP
jgi:hypothetical protein